MSYQDSKDAQIEYLQAEVDSLRRQNAELQERLQAEIDCLRQHCDDISKIKALRQKEIERLTTPTPDGKCAVCGSYIGDTGYYKMTDGEEQCKK